MAMRFVSTLIAALAVACLLAGAGRSTPVVASGGQASVAGTTSEIARLDAVVVDRQGRPVRDLESGDLELRDDGVVQTIEAVEFVAAPRDAANTDYRPITSGRDEKEEAQRLDVRLIALLLDEFHVAPAHTSAVRAALERFVDDELRPGDLVVVMKPLDSLDTILLTRDRAAIRRRVSSFEGRRGDYQPRTPFEETYLTRAPAAADAQRAQVVLAALRSLALHLGELREGRKSLVLVSEGFVRAARRDGQRVPDVQTIVRAANRFDVAIYSADPERGAVPQITGADASRPPTQSDETVAAKTMMRALAEQTGGEALIAGDLLGGLRRVARDLDGYYQVAYRSAHASDGRRHAIDLQVKRPDVRVLVRDGHWAPQPEPPRVTTRPSSIAGLLRTPRRPQQVSSLIRPWFGTSRGSDGRTRLTFTWEPNSRVKPEASALTLTAVGADGTVLFQGRVDPIRATGTGSAPNLSAVFEALPGSVQLDMAIQAADGRTIGIDARDIELPNLIGSGTVLSTPEVFRTRTAREFRALSEDVNAPPVSSREFSRTERLLIRVRAYSSGDRTPMVTARLVGRANQPLRTLTTLAGDPGPNVVQFDVPLSSLAVGEYGVELTAQSETGTARELILFRVTS